MVNLSIEENDGDFRPGFRMNRRPSRAWLG